MATYAELTTEQQNILDHYITMIRSWSGEQARVNNHGDVIDTDYNAQVSAIISLLDAAEVIPNASGLAGAASLTKEEVITLTSHVQGILTNYNTTAHRQLWTKAAGSDNLIG